MASSPLPPPPPPPPLLSIPPAQPVDLATQMSDAERQSFLWQTHSYLAEYARFADTKAAFAGTIAGALIGCLFSVGLFAPLVKTSICIWEFTSWASGLAGLSLCSCIFLAIRVVNPRLDWTGKPGFIFWRSVVAHRDAQEFIEAYRNTQQKHLIDELAGQVFTVSKYVCTPKYRNISYCLWCLAIGSVFAATALLAK
jgi:hypothetical protein